MATTGNMKSVKDIIDIVEDKYTYIPLLQRNYKWTMECASELAEDLWDAYESKKPYHQLNMITIYKKDDSLQILDGQQRLITLKLFLTFLEKNSSNINFAFERDFKINERKGRRYFINYYLKKDDTFQNDMEMSVDIKRLYDNFTSMIIPISFRSVFKCYRECLEQSMEQFKSDLMSKIIEPCLERINPEIKYIMLADNEQQQIYELCEKFNELSKNINKNTDENTDEDNEIRISKYSNQYQEIWNKKIHEVINEIGIDNVISTDKKKKLAEYIQEKVEMLYHETTSEPIDEFLNINENKTRFVISDYIRANMIIDNPIDGNLKEDESTKNPRGEILDLFSSLANYLYNAKYQDMWDLIKQRYDDFEKYPDINRLKILFCDKYSGTSTKDYLYETELKRLTYFKEILESLSCEIGLEDRGSDKQIVWSTYNAVYMLLECKKKYRFFSLFTQDDIEKSIELKDVAIREKFCFFEWAYEPSKSSEDFWDISYFLQSQLDIEKCNVKKSKFLPKKQNDKWCYINRGTDNDELYYCIKQLINEH